MSISGGFGQVYEILLATPDGMTEQQLSEATGAHIKTIRRALTEKLCKVTDRKTGERLEMVYQVGDTWYAQIVDLDLIAAIYHTYAAREEQRQRLQAVREALRG